jgi:GTP-binding protein EngB required for normal cell division
MAMVANLAGENRLPLLEQIAVEAGARHLATEVRTLAERVLDGLFYVACVGQFKRGKSSLINALVGEPVLPVGVLPVTAVVTVVRFGERRRARIRSRDGELLEVAPEALADYVAEERNPGNAKGVAAVEVFLSSPLLGAGMCLVDTPGLGSVFAANSEATRAFVPHIDAALVVLGADPPISADELSIVEEIARQCGDLIFLLNKADKLSANDCREVREFTRRLLAERLGRNEIQIFEVSAAERLAEADCSREWPSFTAALEALARRSGSDLVCAAEDRGLGLLAGRLQHHLAEERRALLRPLEESEGRLEALRRCVAEAERSLNDLGYLFSAEQARLERIFAERKEGSLERGRGAVRQEFAAGLQGLADHRGPALRRRALDLAQRTAKRWLDHWLAEAQPEAESLYVEATHRFAEMAEDFLAKLADSGEPALSALPRTVGSETGFRVRSRLYYTSLMAQTGRTAAGWLFDLLRSRERQLRAVELEVGEYLQTLLETNASRIENDFNDRVLESRRRLQAEIRTCLAEVLASATGGLERAKARRAEGSEAVRCEVEKLDALSSRLAALDLTRRAGVP